MYPLGSQLLCQEDPTRPLFEGNFISFNSVVWRECLLVKNSEELGSKQKYKCKNCIIYETPPRLLASHNSLGSNLWLKRLISLKIKVFTGKGFGEPRGHQLLQSKPRSDWETQCILQCYTQQRKDSNSRKILLTSKRSLSYASKDF